MELGLIDRVSEEYKLLNLYVLHKNTKTQKHENTKTQKHKKKLTSAPERPTKWTRK